MTRDTGAPPNEHDPRGFTPLILAAYHGQVQEVDFLIAEGADPCGRTDIVRLLIAHGASAALKDQAGNTAIGPATRQSRDSGASRRRIMPFANGTAADRGLRSPGVFEAYTGETR